ncbi:hypothetical protein AAMO2058_000346900 [Amorphochlora amoebiformis]
MENLTELENMTVGAIGGLMEVTIMQSTNYWKNAKQQGLPFTMDPRITYRGYLSNCINFVSCTVWQFGSNGLMKKWMLGDSDRKLRPLELIMIQQQRKGGSLFKAAQGITQEGITTWGRGFSMTAVREGLYTGGYLGVTPIIRTKLKEINPTWNEDFCRMLGSICGGLFACYLSHPGDTLKTIMQGDIEQKRFSTHVSSARVLYKESGISAFFRGAPWRLFRQIGGIFILDKACSNLSPLLFPHRF